MPPKNYVLIDFENVQPKNLEILSQHSFKIIVFVGENQTKLPFDLVAGIQEFGSDAKYVKISGNGKNALDFHVAYYIGKLAAEEPGAYFHIISKDTGLFYFISHFFEMYSFFFFVIPGLNFITFSYSSIINSRNRFSCCWGTTKLS